MRNLMLVVAIGTLSACMAEIDGVSELKSEEVVATFHFKADLQQALQSKECVDLHGVAGCTPYPNPMECETLVLEVRADGKTHANCRDRGGSVLLREIVSVASIPFMCRANRAMSCQTCMDVFGNTVLDNCRPRQTALFRQAGSGWGTLPPGAGFIEEPTPATPTTPSTPATPSTPSTPSTPATPPTTPAPTPTPEADSCHYGHAIVLYAKELNKILGHEGLPFHWNPYSHPFPNPSSGTSFFNNSDKDLLLASSSNLTCQQYFASIKDKYKQCPSPGPNGACYYCWNDFFFGGKTCKASRINVAALQAACGKIPAGCDQHAWSAAIVMAYGTSNKDLFQDNRSAFSSGAPPDGTPTVAGSGSTGSGSASVGGTGSTGSVGGTASTGGASGASGLPPGWPNNALPPTTPNGDFKFPNWQGSPLVLDLAGDGIRPTSVASGVRFDLVGAGPLRTAWIQGDDALLALDRNGNGAIDDGTELFGGVSGGRPWEDGFQALAELDVNRDGVIDRRDPAWSQLRLWRDAERSGTSSPSELVTLTAAGIRSISVRPTIVAGAIDVHGNDLRLRGAFTWENGASGTIVDVDFMTSR